MNYPNEVQFLGVSLAQINSDQLNEFIAKAISNTEVNEALWLGNYNVHGVNVATSSDENRTLFESSAFNFCDSQGLALALKLIKGFNDITPLPYNTWMEGMIDEVSRKGGKFYFLGDEEGIIQDAYTKANSLKDGVCVGCRNGFFDLSNHELVSEIVSDINNSGANVLVVGMGMPRQEKFIGMVKSRLGVKIILNGGACFKFYTGSIPKSPGLLASLGLEWMFRLILEPKRLWRRYLIGNVVFLYRLIFK